MGLSKLFKIICSNPPVFDIRNLGLSQKNIICQRSEPASGRAQAKIQREGDFQIFSLELLVLHASAPGPWRLGLGEREGRAPLQTEEVCFYLFCTVNILRMISFKETLLLNIF